MTWLIEQGLSEDTVGASDCQQDRGCPGWEGGRQTGR